MNSSLGWSRRILKLWFSYYLTFAPFNNPWLTFFHPQPGSGWDRERDLPHAHRANNSHMNLHKSKSTLAETSRTSGVDPNPPPSQEHVSLCFFWNCVLPLFLNLHALFHPELIRWSVSHLLGAMLEQNRRDVDDLWLYWSDVWSVIFIFLCGHVCAQVSVYTGVIAGSRPVPWEIRLLMQRPLG